MGVKIIITFFVNLHHFKYGCFRLDPRSENEITMSFGSKLLQMHMSPSIFMIMEREESDLEVNKTDNTTTGAECLVKKGPWTKSKSINGILIIRINHLL